MGPLAAVVVAAILPGRAPHSREGRRYRYHSRPPHAQGLGASFTFPNLPGDAAHGQHGIVLHTENSFSEGFVVPA